jgi:hypothetical protein
MCNNHKKKGKKKGIDPVGERDWTVVKPSVGMSANWNHDWFITVYEKTGCLVVRDIYCLFCIDACKKITVETSTELRSVPAFILGSEKSMRVCYPSLIEIRMIFIVPVFRLAGVVK